LLIILAVKNQKIKLFVNPLQLAPETREAQPRALPWNALAFIGKTWESRHARQLSV
jgi:hypothetical protein